MKPPPKTGGAYKFSPRPPTATLMQSTNTNAKIPAISSARIAGTRKAAAVSSPSSSKLAPPEFEDAAKVSPPPLKPLAGWGLQSFDVNDEEEAALAVAPSKSAAAKKGSNKSTTKVKGRAPSKDKYLLSRRPPADQEDPDGEEQFVSGPAAVDFSDLPSPFNPFADAARADDAAAPRDVVHLRVQQRNGRKTLTTVQGISAAFNYARILRDLKRELCCSGIVVEDEDLGKVVQVQCDHRRSVAAFLVKAGMARKQNVKIRGF